MEVKEQIYASHSLCSVQSYLVVFVSRNVFNYNLINHMPARAGMEKCSACFGISGLGLGLDLVTRGLVNITACRSPIQVLSEKDVH